MTRADRATAEVAAGRDADSGPFRRADRREGLLQKGDARPFGLRETTTVGRRKSDEALEHAESRDECRVARHVLRRRRVDTESVLDRVEPACTATAAPLPCACAVMRLPRS